MRKGLLLIISIISALLLSSLLSLEFNIQTAKAEQYFSDNFENANSWTERLGSWHVANGEYYVSVGIVENGISTVNGLNLVDCTIETQLRFTDSVGYRAGIVFRYSDNSHYYSFEIGNEYDEIDIIKYSPVDPGYGESRTAIGPSAGNSSIIINPNVNYNLRIEVQGSNFSAYLDGQKVLSWIDTSYSSGLVGLRARRADASFDNFKISNATASQATTPASTAGDEFAQAPLDSKWTFVDPSGGSAYSLSANPGWLRISAPAGKDLLPVKFNAPRIARAVTGDFTVETKISAVMDENDEGAGILVWKDSNNYVRLERMSRTIGHPVEQQILFGGSVAGAWPCPGDTHVVLTSTMNPTYLKLVRSNNVLTGWYSSDGTSWNKVGQIPFAIDSLVNIGLAVVNEYHTGVFFADFDYFKIESVSTLPSPAPSPSGLIAHWALDEGNGNTIADSSGNGYQGTIHGANWIDGAFNKALKFNGISEYVSVPSLPVTNINSLTVVAWINTDFSKIGYIFYHGDTGEFLLHNGERTSDGPVAGRYPNIASFSVKLAGSTWYDVYSQPLEPNVWHQLVGVWTKGSSLKIYIDGTLAGENDAISSGTLLNDGSYWLPSLGVYNRGAEVNTFYKGLLDNVMVYNRALSTQEISALYNAPPTMVSPSLGISCRSSTSYSGFNVEIKGNLTFNGTAMSNAPILLSYSVTGGKSWEDLTLVTTGSDGSYSAAWMPSVTGNYMVKATYEGDDNYPGTTKMVNFAVTQFAEKNVFSVSSNSTVSSLVFNSESRELGFTVTGDSGTIGYVDMYIAKSIIGEIANVKAYLDGAKIDYTATSVSDSWLLHFSYQHSTHEVLLSLGAAPSALSLDSPLGLGIIIGTVLIVVVAVALVVLRKRKASQSK